MISDDLKIATLIRKYLVDDLTPSERDELRQWLERTPRNREIFDGLLQREDLLRAESAHIRFARYMDLEASKKEGSGQIAGRFRRVVRYGWYGAAAAIILCGILLTELLPGVRPETVSETPFAVHRHASALLVRGEEQPISISDTTATLPHGLQMIRSEGSQQATLSHIPAKHDTSAVEAAAPVMNRLIIPRGSDFHVKLSDGTEVWLNADSELQYPETFAGDRREVRLKGLAYFKVAKDAAHPFIVHTDRSAVRVLGTEFCVSDRTGGPNLITLVSGSVAVTDRQGAEHTLHPGQQAEISVEGCTVREVETFYYTAWKDGYFIFREAPLREIMDALADWYDLDYTIGDPSLDRIRITARLRKFDDADSVLHMLSEIQKIRFVRQERQVTLLPVGTR